ncbi:hypothetical protein CUMW_057530 [Citrus unshiu]|nr:hypothetical protein CUMW_057530 [Citrus unshiu]
MTASNYRRRFFGDIELAEASAILEGIKLAENLGLTPLVVESDSINVIRLMSRKINSNLEIDWVISEISAFICKKSLFAVKHILRSYNSVAHKVVKMTLGQSESCIWVQETPPNIAFLL